MCSMKLKKAMACMLALEVHGDSEKVLLSSGEIENKNVLPSSTATCAFISWSTNLPQTLPARSA